MRSLHDNILSLEKRRLRENDVAYPVFVAKVPEGKGFVDSAIGGTIVLRFDDIFAMFNVHPLHYTFVRLFSLSMEMRIIRDKTPDIVIVDPFYMCAKLLSSAGDRQVASSHLGYLRLDEGGSWRRLLRTERQTTPVAIGFVRGTS